MDNAAVDSAPLFPPSARASAESHSADLLCDLADRRANDNLERWKSKRALGEPHLSEHLIGAWVLSDLATYHSISKAAKGRIQNRIAENSFAYQGYAEALDWIDPALAARTKPTVDLIMLADFFVQAANLTPEKVRERIDQGSPSLQRLLADSAQMRSMSDELHRRLHWLPQGRIEQVYGSIATLTERDDAVDMVNSPRGSNADAEALKAVSDPTSSGDRINVEVQAVADFIAANKGLMPWKIRENIADADENLQALLMNTSRMAQIHEEVAQLLEGINGRYIDEVQTAISSIQYRPLTQVPNAPEIVHIHDAHIPASGSIPTAADQNKSPSAFETLAANLEPGVSVSGASVRPSSWPSDRPEMPSASSPVERMRVDHQHSANDELQADVDKRSSNDESETLASGEVDAPPILHAGPSPAPESNQPRHSSQPDHDGPNGFVPGVTTPLHRNVEPVGDLLERMTYSSRKDGSVMYSIDDRPAFIDHGDQLLMDKDADHDEHAILGAVLLAKEKYGGAFEITGNREFARRAIEVILKYAVDVRLKNPEQHALYRELANQGEAVKYAVASAEHPVAPIDMKARPRELRVSTSGGLPMTATPQPVAHRRDEQIADRLSTSSDDASSLPAVKVDRLAGKLLDHGEAPFHNIPDNKMSYFVTLENADGVVKTLWGVDLPRALAAANAAINDSIGLKNLGQKPVEVQQPVRDENGKIVGKETIMSHRNKWEVSNFSDPDGATATADAMTYVRRDISKSDGPTDTRKNPQGDAIAPNRSVSDLSHDSQSMTAAEPINRLAGTVVSCGSARLHHKADGPPSYFIELENADGRRHTVWGADLARATVHAEVQLGHRVILQNLGKKSISVQTAGRDDEANGTKRGAKRTQRVVWEVENISHRAPHPTSASRLFKQPAKPASASERDIVPRPGGALRLDATSHNATHRLTPGSPAAIPTATARAHRQRHGI